MRFELAQLRLGAGRVAICSIPGRGGDYPADLVQMQDWRADLVISMVEAHELDRAGAATLAQDLAAQFLSVPVGDFGVPDNTAPWDEAAVVARGVLAGGGRVLVHCFGGCGRSGMAVLRLMTEAGEPEAAAIARLRAVRPCAVETAAQLAWACGAGRAP